MYFSNSSGSRFSLAANLVSFLFQAITRRFIARIPATSHGLPLHVNTLVRCLPFCVFNTAMASSHRGIDIGCPDFESWASTQSTRLVRSTRSLVSRVMFRILMPVAIAKVAKYMRCLDHGALRACNWTRTSLCMSRSILAVLVGSRGTYGSLSVQPRLKACLRTADRLFR